MNNRLFDFLTSCLLWAAALAAPVQAAPPVPLSEYGKLPDVEMSAISPSGDRIAVLTTMRGKRVLLAIQDQTTPLQIIAVEGMKIRSMRWVGEDRLLVTSSQTEDLGYGFTTDKFEFEIGRVIPITPGLEGGIVFSNVKRYVDVILGQYGVREIDGEYFGFFGGLELARDGAGSRRGYQFDHGRPHLFRVNLENFKVKKMSAAASAGFDRDWLIDSEGQVAYTLNINQNTGEWSIRNRKSRGIVSGRQARGAVRLIGISSDGSSAIYTERGEDRTFWWEIGQAGGEPRPFLDDTSFNNLFWNRQTGTLMGYTTGEDEAERHFFADKSLQTKAERVRKAFASYDAWISDWTSDLSDVIVRTSGTGDSGTYYAVNLETNLGNPIAYSRSAIGPDAVGPISTFEYTASDGLEMDGILTLPPGTKEPTNLPVVMLPHGGPAGEDSERFDWWAQAFASRGYAVFQPNFRGSTNRGATFQRAGYGEWGRKMQTDKSDGLAALAKAGIVDPDRACIVGASYGGYAALAGVTIQQGLYKCAVAVAPVSDLRDMYEEDYLASGKERTTRTALREQLGDPDLWNEVSPLKRAHEADAPIMLIHGKEDTVVPYSHSAKMAEKLKDADKQYEFVTLEGEDHWLSLSVTRQQMLENAVRWVEAYNPPD